jgi:glycosyltransferase domain-containing protein
MITILIPLHERSTYINTLLNYYDKEKWPIIVADSSKKKNEYLACFKRIKYLWTPEMPYYQKLYEAALHVETSHLVDVSDDDFTLIKFLLEAERILKEKPETKTIFGQIARFENNPFEDQNFKIEPQRQFIESNNLVSNINKFYLNFFALNHSEIEKSLFKKPFIFVLKNKTIQPIKFFDKIFALFCLIEGNITILNELAQLRRNNSRLIDILSEYPKELEKSISFIEILGRIEKVNPLATLLSTASGILYNQADDCVKKVFKEIQYLK